MPELTRAQRRIISEIDEIRDKLGLDHKAVVDEWEGSEFLTPFLELIRRQEIAAAIVNEYTYIDELLGTVIAKHFLGVGGGSAAWRTKRFRRFNHFILERLYVQQKLALVKDLRPPLKRETVRYIEKVNDLRNAVAHSFFPENLRGPRTTYKSLDVFTLKGFQTLRDDRDDALGPLFERAYGIRG